MKRPFHHGDLRNALIVAAKKLIERKGIEAFALREAARKVGVSANAAYHHFENKDALLSAVASSGFAELATQREEACSKAPADAWSQLDAGAKVYVQFAEARPKLFDLMFGPLGVGSQTVPSSRKPYKQLSEALDNLVLSGRVTPQRRAGAESTLWALIHGLAVLRRAGALREPFDESWEHMHKFIADGLGINLDEKTSK
ncbi:MAG: TetR/AcrR family transcriptional regulator [Candidatus Sulfotelmatobacter sp.]